MAYSFYRVNDNPFNVFIRSGNYSNDVSLPLDCFMVFLARTLRPDKCCFIFHSKARLNNPFHILDSPNDVLRRRSFADFLGLIADPVI
jgi:hypothetical protein